MFKRLLKLLMCFYLHWNNWVAIFQQAVLDEKTIFFNLKIFVNVHFVHVFVRICLFLIMLSLQNEFRW